MNIQTPTWFSQAVCKGKTELFFPREREGARERVKREATARSLCRVCPVNSDCQSYARQNSEWGIWGGENEVQRYFESGTTEDPVLLRKMKAKERRAKMRQSTAAGTAARQAS